MTMSFAWQIWITVLLAVIFYYSVRIDHLAKSMYLDIKCIRYTIEIYLDKITQNKE